jgi:cell division septal protein FtsQ
MPKIPLRLALILGYMLLMLSLALGWMAYMKAHPEAEISQPEKID